MLLPPRLMDGETGVGWRVGAARNVQMQAGQAGRACCMPGIHSGTRVCVGPLRAGGARGFLRKATSRPWVKAWPHSCACASGVRCAMCSCLQKWLVSQAVKAPAGVPVSARAPVSGGWWVGCL